MATQRIDDDRDDAAAGGGVTRDGDGAGERAAFDAERLLLAAIEAAPLGVGVLDRELRLRRANLALERAIDANLLRPHAVEALTRAVSLRMSELAELAERDEAGRLRVSLFPLAEDDSAAGSGVGVLADEDPVLDAERGELTRLLSERLLARQTIDALASELAILDERGRIIMVNRAWREFNAANDPARRDFLGESYLAACAIAPPGDEATGDTLSFAQGLAELMAGRRDDLAFEYPCHSPDEKRWFLARAARFESDGAPRVVITHENVTARRRSEEHYRHIAETLQESLMPTALPSVAGLELAARYRAQGEGFEVGGDFYDVFPDGDGWLLVIGDVCGKGTEAAAVTAEARWTIRALAAAAPAPASLLDAVNRALAGRRRDLTFLTAAIARVTLSDDGARVVCARAGHPHPLVVRAGGSVEQVDGPGGLLGVFEEVRFTEREVDLRPGDALVMFTDGVTEARQGRRELGPEGVRSALAGRGGLAATEIARRLEDAALAFTDGPLRDDLAIVVVRASDRGTPTAPPSVG